MVDIPFGGRMAFQVTALVALTILALMIGSRTKALKAAYYRRLGFVHVLVFAIYSTGLIFIFGESNARRLAIQPAPTIEIYLQILHPIAIIGSNRNCTVGLPPSITISLLGLDLGLNIILTLMLYYLTSKALSKGLGLTFHLALHALPFRDPIPLIEYLLGLPRAQFMAATKEGDKRLRIAKALWGTLAIMIPTAGNLGDRFI
ncbi:MAG: hypothetical protein Q9171_006312 [Xanthocarpia ochracea]